MKLVNQITTENVEKVYNNILAFKGKFFLTNTLPVVKLSKGKGGRWVEASCGPRISDPGNQGRNSKFRDYTGTVDPTSQFQGIMERRVTKGVIQGFVFQGCTNLSNACAHCN